MVFGCVAVQVAVSLLLAWSSMSSCAGIVFPGVVLPQFTDPDTDDLYLEPQTLALFGEAKLCNF